MTEAPIPTSNLLLPSTFVLEREQKHSRISSAQTAYNDLYTAFNPIAAEHAHEAMCLLNPETEIGKFLREDKWAETYWGVQLGQERYQKFGKPVGLVYFAMSDSNAAVSSHSQLVGHQQKVSDYLRETTNDQFDGVSLNLLAHQGKYWLNIARQNGEIAPRYVGPVAHAFRQTIDESATGELNESARFWRRRLLNIIVPVQKERSRPGLDSWSYIREAVESGSGDVELPKFETMCVALGVQI